MCRRTGVALSLFLSLTSSSLAFEDLSSAPVGTSDSSAPQTTILQEKPRSEEVLGAIAGPDPQQVDPNFQRDKYRGDEPQGFIASIAYGILSSLASNGFLDFKVANGF